MRKIQLVVLALGAAIAPAALGASLTCTDNNVAHSVNVETFNFGVSAPGCFGTGCPTITPVSSVGVSFPLSASYVEFYHLAITGAKLSSCVLNASTGTSPTLQVTMQNVIFSSLAADSVNLSTAPATSSTDVRLTLSFQSASVSVN